MRVVFTARGSSIFSLGMVIYRFNGELDNDILKHILSVVDEHLMDMGQKRATRKRINTMLIETLQNQISYGEGSALAYNQWPGLCLRRSEEGFEIEVGNLLSNAKAEKLKAYLEYLNGLSADERKELYHRVLQNGQFNEQGGAGLGFLNLVRKTRDERINFNFDPVNHQQQYFTAKLKV